jgi:hypothetical protein
LVLKTKGAGLRAESQRPRKPKGEAALWVADRALVDPAAARSAVQVVVASETLQHGAQAKFSRVGGAEDELEPCRDARCLPPADWLRAAAVT